MYSYESPVFMPLKHDYSMPCDLAPLACESPYGVSCMPPTFESSIFVQDNPLYEPSDLEINYYILDESQVHASCVSSVETHNMSLGHFDLLPTTLCHDHIDYCVSFPSIGHIMTYVMTYQLSLFPLLLFSFSSGFIW